MKGLILSDLLTVRRYAVQMVVVGIIVGVVIAWGMESASAVMPCVTASFAYGLGFTLLALDEHKGWDGFRAAFPFTRSQVAASRFLSLLVVVALGLALSCVALVLVAFGSQVAPGFTSFMRSGLTAEELVVSASISAAIPLALFCLTVPFAMRWGATRAVQLMGMGIVLVLLGVYVVLAQVGAEVDPLLRFADAQPFGAAAALFAVVLAAYAASAALTCALYRKREF